MGTTVAYLLNTSIQAIADVEVLLSKMGQLEQVNLIFPVCMRCNKRVVRSVVPGSPDNCVIPLVDKVHGDAVSRSSLYCFLIQIFSGHKSIRICVDVL